MRRHPRLPFKKRTLRYKGGRHRRQVRGGHEQVSPNNRLTNQSIETNYGTEEGGRVQKELARKKRDKDY